MDRTLRAALVAALIGLVLVGGMAWFLGLATSTALVSGIVAAALFAALILLAARRADDLGGGGGGGGGTPDPLGDDAPRGR